jgi:hypothetical protein
MIEKLDIRFYFTEKCKSEGVIKKYDSDRCGTSFNEFEWIQSRLV